MEQERTRKGEVERRGEEGEVKRGEEGEESRQGKWVNKLSLGP